MTATLVGLSFPGKALRGPGAVDSLGALCKARGGRAYVLGGRTALAKTNERLLASLARHGVQAAAVAWYGGECTEEIIGQRAAEAVAARAEVIIAVGGGKALDTGKAVAAKCGLPVITVPTIAATCAAVTPLTVLYNDAGAFVRNLFLEDCPAATVVDTAILVDAPPRWLIAGMGDTLAKLYELRAAAAKLTPTSLTISAVANGQICYDIIRRFGAEARRSAETKTLGEAFASTVEAIVLTAGLSSIFGGDKLRNAAAHAIYNGFTTIPATHAVAHGAIVGYGNLCLLALEERGDAELLAEIALAESCGIPVTLAQIADLTEEQMAAAAAAAAWAAAMKCMPFDVSADMVVAAMRRVDSLAIRPAGR
ncbi:MAG: iron-containing alcohol dehydrogenase family protein [Sporomusaceae bacterium]|nr:iron-containing alcohol dehydrogenase family protein [Sporomusaceae bacterium]